MKVVLTKPVDRLGGVGETKEVKSGFARNFLFPRHLAVLANDPRAKSYRAEMVKTRAEAQTKQKVVEQLAQQWQGQQFKIKARASDDGTIYGSIGLKELKKALGRDDVSFEAPTIKKIGRHQLELKLTDNLTVPITVIVEAEK